MKWVTTSWTHSKYTIHMINHLTDWDFTMCQVVTHLYSSLPYRMDNYLIKLNELNHEPYQKELLKYEFKMFLIYYRKNANHLN